MEDFTNSGGSFRGEAVNGSCVWTGRLSPKLAADLIAADADYIVYSYATPIAWHGKDGWTIPDTKYSVTTSNHQNIVRMATR